MKKNTYLGAFDSEALYASAIFVYPVELYCYHEHDNDLDTWDIYIISYNVANIHAMFS